MGVSNLFKEFELRMKLKFMSINICRRHGTNLIGRRLYEGAYTEILKTGETEIRGTAQSLLDCFLGAMISE